MKLIVHIGARKTGTTSVQKVLKQNMALLAKEGVFVTNALNRDADNIFADYFLKNQSSDEKWNIWLAEWKQAMDSGCDRAVISSESLTDLSKDEVHKFATFFRPHFNEFQILFYVRRQDIVATSHYSTALRGGGVRSNLISEGMGSRGLRGFQYSLTAECWENSFGLSAINIRVFPDPRREGWDTVKDFIPFLGLEKPELLSPADQVYNSRLSAVQAAYLQNFNILINDTAHKNAPTLQNRFLKHIENLAGGDKVPQPSRASAEQFYEKFRLGNEALRKRYLPDLGAPLFPENFDMYPAKEKSLDGYFDRIEFLKCLESFENGKFL